MDTTSSESTKHIHVSPEDSGTTITLLDKEIRDDAQSTALRDELVRVVNQSDPPNIILDMRNVEYITSIALLPFAMLRKTIDAREGRVVLCNVSDVVAKVLTVTQILVKTRPDARQVTMADDLEAARQLLGIDGK
jgi:anti-anti-sigma factor